MAGFFNSGKKPVLRGDVIGGRHDSSDINTVRLLRYRPITNFFTLVPVMTSATTGSDVNSDIDVTGKGEEESLSSDSKDDSRMGKCQVCLARRHSSKSGHKLPAAVIGRRCSFPRRRGSECSDMPPTTKIECDTSSVVSGASDASSVRSSDTLYRHGTDEGDIDSDSTNSSDPIRLSTLPENITNRISTCSTASRDLVKIRVFSKYKKTRDGVVDAPAEPYEKKVSKGGRLGFDLSDEEEDDEDEDDDYYYCDAHHCDVAGGLEAASGGCKVCHHTDCQDRNNHRPIMLCSDCDSAIHQEGGDNTGHLRFDLYKKGSTLVRNQSTRSLPGVTSQSAEGSEEDDDDDDTTGSEAPATPTYDHVSTSSTASDVIINNDESKKNQKLRRKKVVKPRRCVTDRTRMRKQRSQEVSELGQAPPGLLDPIQAYHARSHSLPVKDSPTTTDMHERTRPLTPDPGTRVPKPKRAVSYRNRPLSSSSNSVFYDSSPLTSPSPSSLHPNRQYTYSNGDSNHQGNSLFHHQNGDSTESPRAAQHDLSELYTPDELLYSPIRRLQPATSSAVGLGSGEAGPRRLLRQRMDRKVSMPCKPVHQRHSSDKDLPVKKYSLGMEYFTLKFDCLGEQDIEIVAAIKGTSLRDAIKGACERRGLRRMDSVAIYIASSSTPLPLTVDCFPLGGNNLHVRAKDGDFTLPKTPTGSTNPPAVRPRPTQQRPPGMYVKRDATWRQTPLLEPPVMHRRSSLRPPKVTSAVKNEPHPMAATQTTSGSTTVNSSAIYEVVGAPAEENQRPQYERQISQRSKKAADDTSLGDTSPYGTLTDQKTSRPKSHNKISTFFSPFARQLGEKQEQLNDLLNSYSLNMPAMPELLTIGQGAYEPEIFEIENHWTDIVDNSESMTKKEKEQQMRLWELLRTEVEYIKRLKVITDLFMCCLLNLQNEMLLNEIETERVVSNIMEVHKVNCAFWEQHMSQVITHSRDNRTPLDPSLMLEGFQRFEELFTPYTKYCLEQEGCQEYIKNKYRDNELFKTFVIWAEAQNQCNRLKLADLVVTPMQRLTRYKLLLSAILKETQEDSHRESLREMIEHVEKFVNQVNSVMHQRQEQARLSTIIDRIESYDVIDTPNDESARLVSEFCRLDLTCPVPGCGPKQRRHLLREGTLKMKETTNKMDVFCFLFTDMFLVTKANRRSQDKDKVKVIKPPMRLDKIVVHTLRDGVSFLLVYLNEYHMASAVYTFLGDAKPWVDAIRKAQDDYKAMRQTSLQRPESRLMYYDPSEDNDEEYTAVFNNMARSEYSPESTFSRLDSTGSVDGFLPTLSAPYPGSDGQPDYGDDDDRLKRLRSTNMHHGGSADSGASSRPRSPRLQSIPVRRTTSGDSSIQEECPEGGTYLTISSDRRGLNHHQSSPATPESSRGDDGCAPYVPLARRPQSACVRTDSGSSGEAGGYAGGPQKGFFAGQRSHELLGTSEESYKARLNQRRRIGEKRYHTADAIREIGKDRDSAIHKRLSWNFPVNINLEENKPSILKQKTFSSDSLRSVPSSSGVSSTGSLHMSPDTELAEGYESESTTGSTISSKRLSQIELRQGTSPNYHEPGREDSVHRLVAGTMDSPATTTITTTTKGASVEEDTAALGQTNQMSKSMPDISNLSSPGDEDSHHGSNHGSPRQGQRRKMTHAQLQRIKKMMLLNSTLEASEV